MFKVICEPKGFYKQLKEKMISTYSWLIPMSNSMARILANEIQVIVTAYLKDPLTAVLFHPEEFNKHYWVLTWGPDTGLEVRRRNIKLPPRVPGAQSC